jgi:uncharacterized protein DUF6627
MRGLRHSLGLALASLAAALLALSPRRALAEDIPAAALTRSPGSSRDATREAYLDEIRSLLATDAAASRLAAGGVTRETVLERIERMTPAELRYLAQRLREAHRSGGQTFETVLIVLVLVALVILVLVLLDVDDDGAGRHSPSGARAPTASLERGAVLG